MGAGGADGGTAAGIEAAKLNAGIIGGKRHHPAEGVNFPDQMSLADAADGGIAGHLAERFQVLGEQKSLRPGACGGEGCFASGMTAADNNHIKNVGSFCESYHYRHMTPLPQWQMMANCPLLPRANGGKHL